MPSGTTIQQFITDLKERKSQISRAFDMVYQHCEANPGDAATMAGLLRAWTGPPGPLPSLLGYGLTKDLKPVEKKHIEDWPDADKVRNAMVRALEDNGRRIAFFWVLSDDPTDAAPSHSDIEPTAAGDPLPPPGATVVGTGGTGDIKVTFVTPRNKVKESFITIGAIDMKV